MTGKIDFVRSLRGAAWALARVGCVGLLFLGTTHCLPAPAADDGGGAAGSNGGNASQGGTTHASTGGSTYVYSTGGTPQSSSTYTPPTGGTPESSSTYTPPIGGTPQSSSTYTPPTGGTTSAPPAGGSTAVTTCTPAPKSTGGLSCPGGKCTAGTYSGYDFSFSDGKGSTICVDANSLCAAGTTGAQDAAYTVWGAGFGFNLSTATTATTDVPVQLSGSGVSVALTSLPTGADMRVQVTVGGTAYCAVMTAATQTIPWSSFNTTCWAPATGTALGGAPNTPKIQFQPSSTKTAGTFDFCVTSVTFQ